MKVFRDIININNADFYNYMDKLGAPEDLLFLDIETTGFSAASSSLYLIGCAYYDQENLCTIQWLAQKYEEEPALLSAFFEFAESFKCLIHFNGNTFDLPFLIQKCQQYKLSFQFDRFTGIDIYKRISPYKSLLKLPNCKQKTLEQFLGIDRKDVLSGAQLAGLYQDYVKTASESAEKSILQHNQEDLTGMHLILPVLSYYDLFNLEVTAKKVQANNYRDLSGNRHMELLITLALPTPLPKELSAFANNCYFTANGKTGSLRIPIYDEELKFFYSNYKDYYYLPQEDVALHKSVASFVDSKHRVQAGAATCYTRKHSQYLPQWTVLIEPFFKKEYKSKELFFELTDRLKKDRDAFNAYANHILAMIVSTY